MALAIVPNDVALHEMLADILRDCGKLDAALEEFKTAMKLAPANASLETKYATTTLEIAERERERAIAEDMIANPQKYTKRERSPIMAMVLASVVPGLGQFYNGEMNKGVVILSSFLVFLISFAALRSYPRGITTIAEFLSLTNPFVLILGVLAFIAYVYGLIDAPVRAEKSNKAAQAAKKQA